MRVLGIRYGIGRKSPLQDAPEKEPQGGNLIHDCADGQLPSVQQMSLPLPDMIRAQFIGRFAEVPGETLDGTKVTTCCSFREVTSLEFLQHYFSKMGHRDLLVTRHYLETASPKNTPGLHTRSV